MRGHSGGNSRIFCARSCVRNVLSRHSQGESSLGTKRFERLLDSARSLARIIHDGSSRNCGVALRDGRVEPRGTEAYLKQYVEGLSGEPARLHRNPMQACRSSESAIAVEAFMNNAG